MQPARREVEGQRDDLVDEPGVVVDRAVRLARGGGDLGGDRRRGPRRGPGAAPRPPRGGSRCGSAAARRGLGRAPPGSAALSRMDLRRRGQAAPGRRGGRRRLWSVANGVKRPRRPLGDDRLAAPDLDDREVALDPAARREAEGAVDPGEALGLGEARGRERAAALAARLGDQRPDRGDAVVGEPGELVRALAVGGRGSGRRRRRPAPGRGRRRRRPAGSAPPAPRPRRPSAACP